MPKAFIVHHTNLYFDSDSPYTPISDEQPKAPGEAAKVQKAIQDSRDMYALPQAKGKGKKEVGVDSSDGVAEGGGVVANTAESTPRTIRVNGQLYRLAEVTDVAGPHDRIEELRELRQSWDDGDIDADEYLEKLRKLEGKPKKEANTTPKVIQVKGQLYEKVATEKFDSNPGIAIIDPSNLEVQEEHYKILARAIVVAFASAMVAAGIKKPADLVDYREEDLVVQIPKILQKLNQKSGLFRQEMMKLRSKGPAQYAKDAGRELAQIK